MPCLFSEVEAAEAEGVILECLVAPVRLEIGNDGRMLLTCRRMELGAADSSGRARPVPIPGSEHTLEATCVIAAIGQTVEVEALRDSGLALSQRGIAADPFTLATNLQGVFAGGDGVTGADLAVRAVAAGKLAATSIDQYLGGRPVQGDPEMLNVLMGKLDEGEMAELFRQIEQSPRAAMPEIPVRDRVNSFAEVELGLPLEEAAKESSRCMNCGCWKSTTCQLRQIATEYGADPLRFAGARRRFQRDLSHPELVYEPGKCILCGACVKAAAAAGEKLGLSIVGRGFDATVAVPLRGALAEALPFAARRAAEVCPTGAIALKSSGGGCCPQPDMAIFPDALKVISAPRK
jgi:formate dehydrogenase major subunit